VGDIDLFTDWGRRDCGRRRTMVNTEVWAPAKHHRHHSACAKEERGVSMGREKGMLLFSTNEEMGGCAA